MSFTLSKTSGIGSSRIYVSTTPNTSSEKIERVLSIKVNGIQKKSLRLIQNAPDTQEVINVYVEVSSNTISGSGGTIVVTYWRELADHTIDISNLSFSVWDALAPTHNDTSYCTIGEPYINGDGKLERILTFSKNTRNYVRRLGITVQDLISSLSYGTMITQPLFSGIFTWNLHIDETKTATVDEISWSNDIANLINVRATGGTAANNYYPGTSGHNYTSTRFFKDSVLTISPKEGYKIISIVFEATTNNYASVLINSTWTNAKITDIGNNKVLIEPIVNDVITSVIGNTCGFIGITVEYEGIDEDEPTVNPVLKYKVINNSSVYLSNYLIPLSRVGSQFIIPIQGRDLQNGGIKTGSINMTKNDLNQVFDILPSSSFISNTGVTGSLRLSLPDNLLSFIFTDEYLLVITITGVNSN